MSAQEHYDNHLAEFYSWMAGDFAVKQQEFLKFITDQGIEPVSTKLAIDLGAAHGIQSVVLAKAGFTVKAIDFSQQLLTELKRNSAGLNVEAIEDDIRLVNKHTRDTKPELIVCCGDTITHLEKSREIERLLDDCCDALADNGRLLLSFRDYSTELEGTARFIPVKNDEHWILTCFLEYFPEQVRVTDLLYELEAGEWKQKVSSYYKTRISAFAIKNHLAKNGMDIIFDETVNRLVTIIALKK